MLDMTGREPYVAGLFGMVVLLLAGVGLCGVTS
jgi:hypothetical protein